MRPILLVAVLVACGDDGGARDLPDAPSFDAAPGSVTVTVRSGRNPVANHTVYFQGPDSAELATMQTDAGGRATATVPSGSSVTTVEPIDPRFPNGYHNVKTIMGVKPGDDLVLDIATSFDQHDATFTFPPYTGVTTARYSIATQCGGDGVGQGTTHLLGQNMCSPRVDAIVYASDGTAQGEDLAYLVKLDQPLSPAATFDFTGATWQPLTTSTTTFANIPYGERVRSYRALFTPRGRMGGCDGGSGVPPTHTQTMSCPTIPGVTLRENLSFDDNGNAYEVSLLVTAPSSTIDTADMQVRTPIYPYPADAATRTITWTEDPAGATPEFVQATYTRGGENAFNWYILAPYDGTSITVPRLIGDAALFDLDLVDTQGAVIQLGTATGGYDAIRPFGPDYSTSVSDEIERIITARAYDG